MMGLSRRAAITSVLAAGAVTLMGGAFWWNSADTLDDVHAGIVANYPSVEHVSPAEFAKLDKASLLVFDTREDSEFAVSHLSGAIRVSPDLSAEDFLAEYGEQFAGKTVVFYCSVGVRSSRFAERVQTALKAKGAGKVANLEKGLFGWHNDGLPLVAKDNGQTKAIHPYDELWGRLVKREQLITYTP